MMATLAGGTTATVKQVDLNALRTNQILIISLAVVAFVIGTGSGGSWIVAAVAISMAIGTAVPGYGPFQLLYKHLLLRLGVISPKPRQEDPAPHRFAQAVGAAFLTASAVSLLAGATTLGWILTAIVVVLALTNLVFGFCAGCFVFFQLRKAGIGA